MGVGKREKRKKGKKEKEKGKERAGGKVRGETDSQMLTL